MVSNFVMVLAHDMVTKSKPKWPPKCQGALKIPFFSCALPSSRLKRRRWVWKVEFLLISCSPFAPASIIIQTSFLHNATLNYTSLHWTTLYYTTQRFQAATLHCYCALQWTSSSFCCWAKLFWFKLECIREAPPCQNGWQNFKAGLIRMTGWLCSFGNFLCLFMAIYSPNLL